MKSRTHPFTHPLIGEKTQTCTESRNSVCGFILCWWLCQDLRHLENEDNTGFTVFSPSKENMVL